MSTDRGKRSTSEIELKKTLRHAKLAGAVKSTKETAKATTPFVRREKIGKGPSPGANHLLASLDNIASVTNLLRNLENGVSDAPAVSVDNRDDVLNS